MFRFWFRLHLVAGCRYPSDPSRDSERDPVLSPGDDAVSIHEVTYGDCLDNVATLCFAQSMYFGTYSCYSSDAGGLYELLGDTLSCPWVFEQYDVSLLGDSSYWIQCTEYPVHPGGGPGTGGGPPGNPLRICRSNMMSLASSEAMFFGKYNRFGTLEELLEEGLGPWIVCPGCSLDYDLDLGFETYTLTCPLPEEPCHGSIDDFVTSW